MPHDHSGGVSPTAAPSVSEPGTPATGNVYTERQCLLSYFRAFKVGKTPQGSIHVLFTQQQQQFSTGDHAGRSWLGLVTWTCWLSKESGTRK